MRHNENIDFSHVTKFTGYMKIVYQLAVTDSRHMKILDMPAGNGLLSEKFKSEGHEVISADINEERKDFLYVNMESRLPFKDDEFDLIICLEGIEHVVNPANLIFELCRICKTNGRAIISIPNIQNCYSRLIFLFTGTFYQFRPENCNFQSKDYKIDRGHISPLTYFQLRYLFKEHGMTLNQISGDRYKRKLLMPIYIIIIFFGYIFESILLKKKQ
jgi:SAM-dependent methyltransferase